MAIPPKSTTLPDDLNVRTQGVTSSNASTHSRISLDQNASGETTKIAPLEIEGTNVTDAEYPTGIKFWLILMAAFLSLILVGLVRFSRLPKPTLESSLFESGHQHSLYSSPSNYDAFQNYRRHWMVLFVIVSSPKTPLNSRLSSPVV